jgi:hypothetical protein
MSSGHSKFQKFLFFIEFTYNAFQLGIVSLTSLAFSWFQLGNFYLAFYFLFYGPIQSRERDPFNGSGPVVFELVRTLYIFGIVILFISALGNRPQVQTFFKIGKQMALLWKFRFICCFILHKFRFLWA